MVRGEFEAMPPPGGEISLTTAAWLVL